MENKDLIQNDIDIIIPVYGVEKYLHRCVDSVLEQTYPSFDAVLVDDGSSDDSGIICDEYAVKQKNIIVVHKQNGGLSSGRNTGLEVATGDYIAFIDSDDFIEKNYVEKLRDAIKKENCQIAMCSFEYVDEYGRGDVYVTRNVTQPVRDEILSRDQAIDKLTTSKSYYYVVAWNKLYRRNLFENIRYPNGKIHEDEFIIHDLLWQIQKMVCIKDHLYHYTKRSDSIMGKRKVDAKPDSMEAYWNRYLFAKKRKLKKLENSTLAALLILFLKFAETNNAEKQIASIWIKRLILLTPKVIASNQFNFKEKIALLTRLSKIIVRLKHAN